MCFPFVILYTRCFFGEGLIDLNPKHSLGFLSQAIQSGWMPSPLKGNSVQLLSCVWLFAPPWTAAHQASLSVTNSWSLLKLMSIESVMPSNHLILCHPLQCFPESGSFLMSWLFTSGGQSIGALVSASVLPTNIQGWFPLLTCLISLLSKGLPRVFSSTTVWKHQFSGAQPSLWSSSHIHTWLLEKP